MAFTGKNIVPIVDGGAGLGSATKGWGGAFITNVTASSATEGGKLVLAANDGAVMASGHRLGVIEFKGAEDTASTLTIGARIEALCDATWSASENGASLKMYTTDANASESLVLTLDSDKLATFTGAVTVTGALTGTLATVSQPNITGVGTIGTGVWQGTAIASAYLDADTAHLSGAQTFDGAKTFNEITSAVFDGDISVTPRDGAKIHVDAAIITDNDTSESGTATSNHTIVIEAQVLAATNASVTNTHAASLYISGAPNAGTNMTLTNPYALWVDAGLVKFDGALTVGGTITGNVTGDLTGTADTVATIAGLAPNTATTQATQPAIESIGTDGDTLSILSDTLLMSNTSTDTPVIKLLNTTDDDQAGQLIFEKLRDDDAVATGQNLGEIWFRGQDAAQNTEDYAYILAEIDVSTSGQESGKLSFGVAGHDGSTRTAAKFTGGSESTEVDATIGLGANSVVSIPGNIDLAGDIDVDGTLETDALTVGGTAFTPSTTKNMTHHTIKDDIGTAVVYISLGEIDAESGTISNKNLPLLAPVGGKLLKIFVRTTTDMSGADLTWRLLTRAVSASTTGNAAVIGTATAAAGPTGSSMVIYDFTSVDSNVINAGDKVQISVQANTGVGESSYYITCLWEWDLS